MNRLTPFHFYSENCQQCRREVEKIEHKVRILYYLRLISFLLFVIFVVLFLGYTSNLFYLTLALVSFIVFLHNISQDIKYGKQKLLATKRMELNSAEIASLNYQYSDRKDGIEYKELNPYLSDDFNLFGKNSLFQYLNRCSTLMGEQRLAEELSKQTLTSKTILDRQIAIKELSTKMEFVQAFQTYGMCIEERGGEITSLISWVLKREERITKFRLLAFFIVALNGAWILLAIFGILSSSLLLIAPLVSGVIIYLNKKRVACAHYQLEQVSIILDKYLPLFKLVAQESFESPLLKQEREVICNDQSSIIKSLSSLIALTKRFDVRNNVMISEILNILLAYDFHTFYGLAKWKSRNSTHLPAWFSALSTFDCLISYAVFATNNQEHATYPQIVNDRFCLKATEVGHPLLPTTERICNDIYLEDEPSITIITGANMAGKSTFLRTVSINLILGVNGAPVIAKQMIFQPCHLMSSIKIQDSLAKGESYFYAELLRLKAILEYIQKKPQTLVILDEILRGTNTKDKQLGSLGYIEKLIAQNAKVIIATHDLAIGQLEDKHPNSVKNYCFEVELHGEQLSFDYKLKNGVTQKLNASHLMKKMGLIA